MVARISAFSPSDNDNVVTRSKFFLIQSVNFLVPAAYAISFYCVSNFCANGNAKFISAASVLPAINSSIGGCRALAFCIQAPEFIVVF